MASCQVIGLIAKDLGRRAEWAAKSVGAVAERCFGQHGVEMNHASAVVEAVAR